MDETSLLKAWARLHTFRQNLPNGSIEETYVAEYHNILQALEQQTGHKLDDFLIPDAALEHKVSSFTPASRHNRFQAKTNYTRSRYCERELFLMRLDAAITFFGYLTPEEGKKRIGF